MITDGGLFSVTWYFLLSWSSETSVCTNTKPRHCSGLWYSLRLQVAYVQRAPPSLKCSQTSSLSLPAGALNLKWPNLLSSEGFGLFPAGLLRAGIKLSAMHTLRSLGVLTKLLNSCPSASPALKQRVISGFTAVLIPSPYFSSYRCFG